MTVVYRVGDTAVLCDPGCPWYGHRCLEDALVQDFVKDCPRGTQNLLSKR